MTEWASAALPMMRRQCPECDWHMDEPPPQFATEWRADGSLATRVRMHSAARALAEHVVRTHPRSELAAQIRDAAAAHLSGRKES